MKINDITESASVGGIGAGAMGGGTAPSFGMTRRSPAPKKKKKKTKEGVDLKSGEYVWQVFYKDGTMEEVVAGKDRHNVRRKLSGVYPPPSNRELGIKKMTKITRPGRKPQGSFGFNNTGYTADRRIEKKIKDGEVTVGESADTLNPPSIDVGDEVKVGKFKNSKAEVKGFTKDDHGQPVLKTTKGDQKLYKPRVSKLEPKVNEDLDIPREKMPQVHVDELEKKYAVRKGQAKLSKIEPSQEDRIDDKVDDIKQKIESGKPPSPIIIDKDWKLIDGHHRYEAYMDLGHDKIPAAMVDATLAEIFNDYKHTRDDTPVDESTQEQVGEGSAQDRLDKRYSKITKARTGKTPDQHHAGFQKEKERIQAKLDSMKK